MAGLAAPTAIDLLVVRLVQAVNRQARETPDRISPLIKAAMAQAAAAENKAMLKVGVMSKASVGTAPVYTHLATEHRARLCCDACLRYVTPAELKRGCCSRPECQAKADNWARLTGAAHRT